MATCIGLSRAWAGKAAPETTEPGSPDGPEESDGSQVQPSLRTAALKKHRAEIPSLSRNRQNTVCWGWQVCSLGARPAGRSWAGTQGSGYAAQSTPLSSPGSPSTRKETQELFPQSSGTSCHTGRLLHYRYTQQTTVWHSPQPVHTPCSTHGIYSTLALSYCRTCGRDFLATCTSKEPVLVQC